MRIYCFIYNSMRLVAFKLVPSLILFSIVWVFFLKKCCYAFWHVFFYFYSQKSVFQDRFQLVVVGGQKQKISAGSNLENRQDRHELFCAWVSIQLASILMYYDAVLF